MKRLTWSLALVLAVLAAGNAAQAAVVDVTLSFDKTTGITVGETVNWTLDILVTGNAYDFGGNVIDLGVQAASIGLASSGAGVVEIAEGYSPVPPPGGLTGKPATGTVVANTAAEPTGFGAQSLPISPAYGTNRGLQPILLSGTITSGLDGWNGDYSDSDPELKKGVGTAIVHMSGTMVALADGTVTYTPFIVANGDNYNISVYTGDTGAYTFSQRSVNETLGDTLNLVGATLTVGGGVVTIPVITPGAVAEGDWTGPTGWNNPARTVSLSVDPNGNAGDPEWFIDDGNGYVSLGTTTGTTLDLTIQDLIDAGLTPPTPKTPFIASDYEWDLKASVGGVDSDPIKIFVPEPTTMGLLGFGVIGALLRRRRRA